MAPQPASGPSLSRRGSGWLGVFQAMASPCEVHVGETDRATAERVVAIVTRLVEVVIANPGMQRWLADEGELAMRLLTRSDRGFQPRLIDWVDGLLDAEAVELEADRREVAYVIVRVIESYTYLDLILGECPDARRAEPILRLLLR